MREVEGVGAHRKLLDAARAYVGTFAHFSPNARRVLLATVCIYTSWGVFGVLFNLYLVALGHTLAFVGLVAAVTTVGQAAISPVMAWVPRQSDPRTALAAGAAMQVLALALSALVTSGAALAAAAALSGAALSIATIPIYPYMMNHTTARDRSHLFSAYFAASQVGTMFGSLLSGALPAIAVLVLRLPGHQIVTQDRAGLLVGALFTVLSVWAFWTMRAEAPAADTGDRPAQIVEDDGSESRLRGDVLIMLGATGLVALVLGATLPFFNVYFAQRLHANTATIGTIYALSGIACTVAAFLAPAAGWFGNLPAFSATRVLTAPIFVLFWLHPGLAIAAFAYIGRNTLATISGALENTFAMEVLPPRLRGNVAGWRSFAFYAAWSIGSLVAGTVVARFGYDVIFLMGGLLTMIGAGSYFVRFKGRG